MLNETCPVSESLLFPRASNIAPDTSQQDKSRDGDVLAPLTRQQALTQARKMDAEALHGDRSSPGA